MTLDNLQKNKEFLTNEFEKLLNLYPNKYVLINDNKVVGSFDTYESAAEEGVNSFGINSGFLVQLITDTQPINFVAVAKL